MSLSLFVLLLAFFEYAIVTDSVANFDKEPKNKVSNNSVPKISALIAPQSPLKDRNKTTKVQKLNEQVVSKENSDLKPGDVIAKFVLTERLHVLGFTPYILKFLPNPLDYKQVSQIISQTGLAPIAQDSLEVTGQSPYSVFERETLKNGWQFNKKYENFQKLGKGGCGEVWRAQTRSDSDAPPQTVVLKRMLVDIGGERIR
eukprot:Platyproteum_vivax@DN12642_c0_g1_i1.p1